MSNDLSRLKRQPYVTRRGNTLHYRRRGPKGAEQRFGGKREFVRTLEARSLREAQAKLAAVIAEYEQLAVAADSPALAMAAPIPTEDLANRLARQHMRLVQKINSSALAHFPADEAETWAREYKTAALRERQTLALGELPEPWLLSAKTLVKEAGIEPAANPQFVAQVARAVGELRAEYSMQLAYQLNGEPGRVANEGVFGATAYAADSKLKQAITLADAAARFLANPMKEIAASTLQQYRPRMKVLVEALGATKAITDITRSDCRRITEEVILRLPANVSKKYRGQPLLAAIKAGEKDGAPRIGLKTQRLYIELLKTFFAWAEQDELIESSPARKVALPKGREEETRAPFSLSNLQTVFQAPLYTGCADDDAGYATLGRKTPRRHRFWIPLIALFSGMRLEEIALLRRRDIIEHRGVHAFNLIEDLQAGRKLKTAGSARQVPIHPTLIRLGLLEYAEGLPEAGWLFPDLVASAKHPGDAFGKWFGRFLDSVEICDKKLVFHSFRHTFATGCRECGIPLEQYEAIGGWKYQGTSGVYGKQSLQALARALARLEYPGLDLSHLYTDD
ncbi:MAG: site-specific integrase [Verrucomicrobiaceae bacterium]|nr:MAG: site-specific integrase [Verrucomicrobiaceae bacterium]